MPLMEYGDSNLFPLSLSLISAWHRVSCFFYEVPERGSSLQMAYTEHSQGLGTMNCKH